MHLDKSDIQSLDRIKRLNLINSVSGIKAANLIGTIFTSGSTNLAIFSSVVHIGSDPPLLGFILRPDTDVRRHTFENIMDNGFFTINQVHQSFLEQAHYTSAKFEAGISEFERCGLTESYLFDFPAPFVQESKLKIGMQFRSLIPIPLNGTTLVIGEIVHLELPDRVVNDAGHCDLSGIKSVGISGLNSYYALEKIAQFPYARLDQLPDFGIPKDS